MRALPVDRTLRPGSERTTEMNVDFPVPLRPTRPTFSPAPTTKEASRSRVRSPISMVREEPTIMGGGGDLATIGAFLRSGVGDARRDQPGPVSHTDGPAPDRWWSWRRPRRVRRAGGPRVPSASVVTPPTRALHLRRAG